MHNHISLLLAYKPKKTVPNFKIKNIYIQFMCILINVEIDN